jgi:hypothetical protein
MSSSGVDVDCARCHALRSRSRFGSVVLRKRAVRQSPLARRRCRVHGGTKEWVAERAPFSNLEQTRDFGWICRLNAKTEA